MLWVVLRLKGVLHDIPWANGDAVGGIGLLMLNGVGVIDVPLLILIGAGHEHKQGIVLDGSIYDLHGIFQSAVTERIDVVAGGGDADHQLIGVCFHRLFEAVVLAGFLEGMYFVGDGDIAVE